MQFSVFTISSCSKVNRFTSALHSLLIIIVDITPVILSDASSDGSSRMLFLTQGEAPGEVLSWSRWRWRRRYDGETTVVDIRSNSRRLISGIVDADDGVGGGDLLALLSQRMLVSLNSAAEASDLLVRELLNQNIV